MKETERMNLNLWEAWKQCKRMAISTSDFSIYYYDPLPSYTIITRDYDFKSKSKTFRNFDKYQKALAEAWTDKGVESICVISKKTGGDEEGGDWKHTTYFYYSYGEIQD